MESPIEFYNNFDNKLIKDFIKGNKRLVNAIEFLGSYIDSESKHVLDIGCGLGWSSFEFAREYPNVKVTGVDLSPVLIEAANKMFHGLKNLNFIVHDLIEGLPEGSYDVVSMIDVYEHIPLDQRKSFHVKLKGVLSQHSKVLLACPSKFHQENLRQHKPEGLQPVDEDVDVSVIQKFADDIDGEIVFFEYKNIWGINDYLYAVIELKPSYKTKAPKVKRKLLKVEPKEKRVKRLKERMCLEIANHDTDKSKNIKASKKSFKNLVKKFRP
ncbi:class I SAM-dependent methyltransferase [Subsaxibacter sp. CAU 1640]|uniref:class I SAM-dependent methyltransferase n=1 Tax=Subsaxibacter sp. CAU 1640 TaxID=2933271 RepID=UPI002003307C|nr:class I SAM-dependent methyltransferase [Subsaxibacter sp. CAU 1640]MCK7589905.1 class I SAM-dependent methyltransferase [Subsaxibacter sp. CAU 1640]